VLDVSRGIALTPCPRLHLLIKINKNHSNAMVKPATLRPTMPTTTTHRWSSS
jgi:hypothetical protein